MISISIDPKYNEETKEYFAVLMCFSLFPDVNTYVFPIPNTEEEIYANTKTIGPCRSVELLRGRILSTIEEAKTVAVTIGINTHKKIIFNL